MSPALTLATTARVLAQLRHDPRTLALVLVVPSVLLWLFAEIFGTHDAVYQRIAPMLLGVFPFVVMFLVTSVAMVRERTGGTLERLLTTPLGKADLVLGYGLAFGLLALVQALVTSAVALGLLGVETPASLVVLLLLAVANSVLGTALGLGVSALATTEFQAVQFMPAVVLPQVLLCGLFTPTEQMAGWLQTASYAVPLRYAMDGITALTGAPTVQAQVWVDLGIVAGLAVAALVLGATTLRRRTA